MKAIQIVFIWLKLMIESVMTNLSAFNSISFQIRNKSKLIKWIPWKCTQKRQALYWIFPRKLFARLRFARNCATNRYWLARCIFGWNSFDCFSCLKSKTRFSKFSKGFDGLTRWKDLIIMCDWIEKYHKYDDGLAFKRSNFIFSFNYDFIFGERKNRIKWNAAPRAQRYSLDRNEVNRKKNELHSIKQAKRLRNCWIKCLLFFYAALALHITQQLC